MSANSNELRLAMRALKTYRTHLRNAHARMCAPEAVRCAIDVAQRLIGLELDAVAGYAAKADAHLAAQVRARRKALSPSK